MYVLGALALCTCDQVVHNMSSFTGLWTGAPAKLYRTRRMLCSGTSPRHLSVDDAQHLPAVCDIHSYHSCMQAHQMETRWHEISIIPSSRFTNCCDIVIKQLTGCCSVKLCCTEQHSVSSCATRHTFRHHPTIHKYSDQY